jgi:hypothetical protein
MAGRLIFFGSLRAYLSYPKRLLLPESSKFGMLFGFGVGVWIYRLTYFAHFVWGALFCP